MIEKIKKAVFANFNPDEKKGVFLSGFSKDQELITSHGVLHTDTPLHEAIETVYSGYLEKKSKKIRYVVCDVVEEVIDMTHAENLLDLSAEEFGFAAVDTEDELSGVILPNTSGVSDAKSALYDLKQKYGIHGKVEIYAFRTKRIVIAK